MKNKHTPGPWTYKLKELSDGVNDDGQYINVHTYKDYYSISAGVGYWDKQNTLSGFELTGYLCEGNAKMLASAPSMFEAIQKALERCRDTKEPNTDVLLDDIEFILNEAIEKATS